MHLLSVALFTFFQGFPVLPPAPPAPDKVMAVVDGVAIKAADVAPYLWDWGAKTAVDELIDSQLVIAEAKRKGIELTDAELSKLAEVQLEPLKASLPPGTTVADALMQRGSPITLFATRLRKQVLLDRLFEKEFTTTNYLKLSTLVFPIKSSLAEDLQLALTKAKKAYDSLKKGSSWDKVIEANMEDPSFRDTKGLLGWRDITGLPEPAMNEIKGLATKGFTKPVQTANGIQIFRVEMKPSEASKGEIDALRTSLTPSARSAILARIKAAAKVERNPAPKQG